MIKEYFITTPLIFAPVKFYYKDCTIHLLGSQRHSYIEGPSAREIDDAFEVITAIQHCSNVGGLRVQLRRNKKRINFPNDPRKIRGEQWTDWAFSCISLKSIPLIRLDKEECNTIQIELTSYEEI